MTDSVAARIEQLVFALREMSRELEPELHAVSDVARREWRALQGTWPSDADLRDGTTGFTEERLETIVARTRRFKAIVHVRASSWHDEATVRAGPQQVLIVDDNKALAENIAEILQSDGHGTRVAASAEEGTTMAYASWPDVIVTDFRLPGLNGADFLAKLRESWMQVYAIVISGDTDERTVTAAKAAGASFMAKPLNLNLLSRWVRRREASTEPPCPRT